MGLGVVVLWLGWDGNGLGLWLGFGVLGRLLGA